MRSSAERARPSRRCAFGDRAQEIVAFGQRGLRGGRRRGRAHVGDELDQRHVAFVTDRGHGRRRTRGDRPDDAFVGESEQVLIRTAAAHHHDEIEARRVGGADRVHDLRHRAHTVDRGGKELQRDVRRALTRLRHEIARAVAGRRTDERDAKREARRGLFALG